MRVCACVLERERDADTDFICDCVCVCPVCAFFRFVVSVDLFGCVARTMDHGCQSAWDIILDTTYVPAGLLACVRACLLMHAHIYSFYIVS